MTKYQKGDRVVYFQPNAAAILDMWAGGNGVGFSSARTRGSEKTVTVTSAKAADGIGYYDTDAGVFLTDDDIVRKA